MASGPPQCIYSLIFNVVNVTVLVVLNVTVLNVYVLSREGIDGTECVLVCMNV